MLYVVTTGNLAYKLKGYEDEEEEEDEEDSMMAVQGSDGQQYVVLEVIQLADNQGTDQVSDMWNSLAFHVVRGSINNRIGLFT